jgi:hypothetical protein
MEWKWFIVSIIIFFILQLILTIVFGIIGVITLGIGFILFLILKPAAYFIGGFLTGLISPGITMKEPAFGAASIAALGLLFDLLRFSPGKMIGTIIATVVAFFIALIGAYLGEKVSGSDS